MTVTLPQKDTQRFWKRIARNDEFGSAYSLTKVQLDPKCEGLQICANVVDNAPFCIFEVDIKLTRNPLTLTHTHPKHKSIG